MILVDSSVWIDYFRGVRSTQTDRLDALLSQHEIAIGDLMLAEVLQGFGSERDFRRALQLLSELTTVSIGGAAIAIQAARHYRTLRERGITVRKTIDTLIATWAIENRCPLLYSDRDFEPFVEQLGLVSAL